MSLISKERYWAHIHRVGSLILSQMCMQSFAHTTSTSVYVKSAKFPSCRSAEPTLNSRSAMVNIIIITVSMRAGKERSQVPGCCGDKIFYGIA